MAETAARVGDVIKAKEITRDELFARLSRELPRAVDQYTPHGRIPAESEFSRP